MTSGPNEEVVAALQPSIEALAKYAGISVEVFLWDDMHDRYLILDLIGLSLPWVRNDEGAQQGDRGPGSVEQAATRFSEFDPAHRQPRHHFVVSPT